MAGSTHTPRRAPQGQRSRPMRSRWISVGVLVGLGGLAGILAAWMVHFSSGISTAQIAFQTTPAASASPVPSSPPTTMTPQGWPLLDPLPAPEEIWECEVIVVGGSLGGIAAAAQAMQAGAQTCLIELTPWLGGQISSQGVGAVDESLPMRQQQNFSEAWLRFKQLIAAQAVSVAGSDRVGTVGEFNACWVGSLCFSPRAGAEAAEQLLQQAQPGAPGSRWSTHTAFKGAEFDPTGTQITAVYGVRRVPRDPDYIPSGRLSREFSQWYGWADDPTFDKIPIRLQGKPGQPPIVIDATDTGELVGWANIPHRLGSEAKTTTGEPHGSAADNPECTQAFTYPFVLAIADDGGRSLQELAQLQTGLSKAEHRREFDLEGFPMFGGKSVFQYRRSLSLTGNDPFYGSPALGDQTLINWNRGNDWGLMNPPLLMTQAQIVQSGQRQNWQGGMNFNALKDGENHALLFAEWLIQTQAQPNYPLSLLRGPQSPMGTASGLSLYPYIREGRRILGGSAYGESSFLIREQDIRVGLSGRRDFSATAVAITHYAIDMHGCRYRNWEPSLSANSAPINEFGVHPITIPLEALIPQRVDNLLIGGKGIAVTHIVNAATRVHYGEWGIGSAAGAVAGWLLAHPQTHQPAQISAEDWPQLRQHLQDQGLRLQW